MNTENLLKEINLAFPSVAMPSRNDLLFRTSDVGCFEGLIKDIEEYRGKEVSSDLIRLLHQEMSNLSAKAWLWILPPYLKYCLTPDAEYSQMEVEFLIYAFSPSLEFESDTLHRLSLLNINQINCLVHFIDWCKDHRSWSEYCPNELDRANSFLSTMQIKNQSN